MFGGNYREYYLLQAEREVLCPAKGAPSKKRLKEGKEFENSRRASSEFGHASKMASKLVQSCRIYILFYSVEKNQGSQTLGNLEQLIINPYYLV